MAQRNCPLASWIENNNDRWMRAKAGDLAAHRTRIEARLQSVSNGAAQRANFPDTAAPLLGWSGQTCFMRNGGVGVAPLRAVLHSFGPAGAAFNRDTPIGRKTREHVQPIDL